MNFIQHKFLGSALAIVTLVFVDLWLVTLSRRTKHKADIGHAHDMVRRLNQERDLALKADPAEAVVYLERLHFLEGRPSPFSGSLAYFVEAQRRRAVEDVIVHLRAKTGKDLGDKPEPWIEEFRET